MVYVLMCDDVAAGGQDARADVDAVLAGTYPDPAEAQPARPGPDRETWGLAPDQVASAQAAMSLGSGR